MTAKINCNFCNKDIELGYGNPSTQEFNVNIKPHDGDGVFRFSLNISYRAIFNTTNVHWCRECLLDATEKQLSSMRIERG